MNPGARALERIERNTTDLDRAVTFYRDALGFEVIDANPRRPAWTRLPGANATPSGTTLLALGAQRLSLTAFRGAGRYPPDSTACDLWFQHCAIVVRDMPIAHARVIRHGATAITQGPPQLLPPSTGAVTAFKFRDPDGHPLELIEFPRGTGDPVWQSARAHRMVLGIDHSAISVSDTACSIRFYELLGLRVAARGVNRGVEQQQLDNLSHVEVDVVAMQGRARSPHLELLGYREPRGRPRRDARTTAISADRMAWQVCDVGVLLDALDDAGSADAVIARGSVDGATVALLRDPDGHLVVLTSGKAQEGCR